MHFLLIFLILLTVIASTAILRWRLGSKSFVIAKAKSEELPESRFCFVNGARIHFIVEGEGPDILLLHGLAASVYCWRFLVPLLKKNFRVWSVDIRGFGQSDASPDARYDLKSQAENIRSFLKINNVYKTAVVGNSMGGAIACELAATYPSLVTGLILINSAHDPLIFRFSLKPLKNFVPVLAPFIKKAPVKFYMRQLYGKSHRFSDDDVKAYLEPYVSRDRERYRAFLDSLDALTDKSLIERIHTIKAKTLIVWGKTDRLIPVKFGIQLQKLIRNSQLVVHATAGHHLQEEEPQWLSDQITSFFDTSVVV